MLRRLFHATLMCVCALLAGGISFGASVAHSMHSSGDVVEEGGTVKKGGDTIVHPPNSPQIVVLPILVDRFEDVGVEIKEKVLETPVTAPSSSRKETVGDLELQLNSLKVRKNSLDFKKERLQIRLSHFVDMIGSSNRERPEILDETKAHYRKGLSPRPRSFSDEIAKIQKEIAAQKRELQKLRKSHAKQALVGKCLEKILKTEAQLAEQTSRLYESCFDAGILSKNRLNKALREKDEAAKHKEQWKLLKEEVTANSAEIEDVRKQIAAVKIQILRVRASVSPPESEVPNLPEEPSGSIFSIELISGETLPSVGRRVTARIQGRKESYPATLLDVSSKTRGRLRVSAEVDWSEKTRLILSGEKLELSLEQVLEDGRAKIKNFDQEEKAELSRELARVQKMLEKELRGARPGKSGNSEHSEQRDGGLEGGHQH